MKFPFFLNNRPPSDDTKQARVVASLRHALKRYDRLVRKTERQLKALDAKYETAEVSWAEDMKVLQADIAKITRTNRQYRQTVDELRAEAAVSKLLIEGLEQVNSLSRGHVAAQIAVQARQEVTSRPVQANLQDDYQ